MQSSFEGLHATVIDLLNSASSRTRTLLILVNAMRVSTSHVLYHGYAYLKRVAGDLGRTCFFCFQKQR